MSEASEGSGADTLPLVVRSADAFGELIYIGVDLKSSVLEHWQALPQLLAALLGRSIAEGQSLPAASGAFHLGYNDMSGQLRRSRSISSRTAHAVLVDSDFGRGLRIAPFSGRFFAETTQEGIGRCSIRGFRIGGLAVVQLLRHRRRRLARRLVACAVTRRSGANQSGRRDRLRRRLRAGTWDDLV